ncbi:MAG: chalcone isomerase family protein [Pseudobdellovibrionaceae bacterium]
MKNLVITLAAVVAMTSSASAALLTTTKASGKSIEAVSVSQEATVAIDNQQIPVSIIGAGLRAKKVAIVNVKVYVGELLSSDASKFIRDEKSALNSLDQSRTIAYRLSFVRTVDAPTVQSSFAEALKVNGVDVKETAIAQFLAAVAAGGDANSGKSLTIIAQKNSDKTESVYYEDSNGKVTKINGPAGFSKKVMVICLGKGADAGVDSLRTQIVKGL